MRFRSTHAALSASGSLFAGGVLLSCQAPGAVETPSHFVDVTVDVGVSFVHEPAVEGSLWLPESIGSGVALFDYDGDGRLDLYFLNGAWRDSTHKPTARNALYRQRADNTFEDVTQVSRLGDTGYGTAAAVGDYDNDGDLDVYVGNVLADALYENEGDGTFTNVTSLAGITNERWSSAVAFVDVDDDGWLDLFVANYVEIDTTVSCVDRAGREFYCPQYRFPGTPDALYRNRGDGTFVEVSGPAGISATIGRALGLAVHDFNADGRPDIYVANDSDPNRMWINLGGGVFRDDAPLLGVAVNAVGAAEASMGVAVGDVGNTGTLDIFLTHLREESNTLYRQRVGIFRDESFISGVGSPSLPLTGFGTVFIDVDLDANLDLVIANGRIYPGPLPDSAEREHAWAPFAEPNMVLVQNDSGRFENASARFPAISGNARTSRGLAYGDLDNDGDLDLVATHIGSRPSILRNETSGGNWLVVDPRPAVGTLGTNSFSVYADLDGVSLRRLAQRTTSFMTSVDPRVHFGLGPHQQVDAIRVAWPDGLEERFPGGPANRIVTVTRGEGTPVRN